MTLRVLTVCTGNVCRSPMAERLLRAGLAERFGEQARSVEVASAGTGALVGEPMTAATQALVTRHGAHAEGHRARMLEPALVEGADLVLAMTRQHRGAVALLHPRAARRSFTVREAARLAPLVDPGALPDGTLEERFRALVPELAARRGLAPPDHPADDDVADPYRRPADVYEAMAAQLVPAVTALLDALGRKPSGAP